MSIALEIDTLFSGELAVPAVYNDGTTDHEVSVVVFHGGPDNKRQAAGVTAYVPVSDVPSPQYKQTITIDGTVWDIDQVPGDVGYSSDGGVWQLPLTSDRKVRPGWGG